MLYLVTIWYPRNQSKEVARIYESLPPSSIMKVLNVYLTRDGEHGAKTYFLMDLKDGTAEAAEKELWERTAKAFIKIIGLRWQKERLTIYNDAYKNKLLK